jgi:hypothetical protein
MSYFIPVGNDLIINALQIVDAAYESPAAGELAALEIEFAVEETHANGVGVGPFILKLEGGKAEAVWAHLQKLTEEVEP